MQSKKDKKIQIELKKKASGLTKKDVKFEKPISFKGNRQLLEQKKQKIPEQIVTNIFDFDELSHEAQEKAIEKRRQLIMESGDNFFAEDQGIIFDDNRKLAPEEIGLNNPLSPSAYDLAGTTGDFIQYADLKVEDKKKFNKYLGLSDKVLEKVNYEIQSSHDSGNTRLVFFDNSGGNSEGSGGEISLSPDIHWIDEHYEFDANEPIGERMFQQNDIPTVAEGHEVLDAFDRFADLMDDSLKHLKNNYESQFEEKNIKEDFELNENKFDKNGDIA